LGRQGGMVFQEPWGWPHAIPAAVTVGRAFQEGEVRLDANERAAVARQHHDRALAEHGIDCPAVEAQGAKVRPAQQRPRRPEEFRGRGPLAHDPLSGLLPTSGTPEGSRPAQGTASALRRAPFRPIRS
jgi:hypothetical protein